jgi:hypothetical protein
MILKAEIKGPHFEFGAFGYYRTIDIKIQKIILKKFFLKIASHIMENRKAKQGKYLKWWRDALREKP